MNMTSITRNWHNQEFKFLAILYWCFLLCMYIHIYIFLSVWMCRFYAVVSHLESDIVITKIYRHTTTIVTWVTVQTYYLCYGFIKTQDDMNICVPCFDNEHCYFSGINLQNLIIVIYDKCRFKCVYYSQTVFQIK